MSEYIIKYPLDLTGETPENRIEGEPHVLEPGLNRSLVPRYGAFYTDGLVVRDADTTEILTPNDQYIPIMYHAEASERAGKEVCAGIVVLDGTVSDNVVVDYQVVGGDYQNLTQVILDLIENLNLDEREVMWGDLLGRPDAFPPAQHLHDLGDIFGFEYLVQAVSDLRDAVLYGDVASHDEIKAMIEARRAELQQNIDTLRSEYEEHRDRDDNPHEVTKAQVGLGSVENHPLASQNEAETGTSNARYMTPVRTQQAIQVFAVAPLDTHKADYTNPHRVTKAQVGLGSVENLPLSTQTEAEEGTVLTSYMTPLRVSQAISEQAIKPLTAHTDRTDNPHNVTKAQVGLGLVSNFPTADQTEAEAGTANNRFMTPLRVAQAISEQAGTMLQQHMDDTSNPHQVTKAQVGLGSVPNWIPATTTHVDQLSANEGATLPNAFMTPVLTRRLIDKLFRAGGDSVEGLLHYRGDESRMAGTFDSQASAPSGSAVLNYNGYFKAVRFYGDGRNLTGMVKGQVGLDKVDNFATATQADAVAGTASDLFMTPLRVAQAITAQAGAAVSDHIENTSNPHQVTKAQVGLGSVQNYGIASQAAAQSGTANNLYMTPLRVAEAITSQAGAAVSDHVDNTSNPHQVTAAQVGLGNVGNYPVASQAEAQAGTANNRYMTPLRVDQLLNNRYRDAASGDNRGALLYNGNVRRAGAFYGGASDPVGSTRLNLDGVLHATGFVGSGSGLTGLTKAQVGLGNVDNYGRDHYDARYVNKTGDAMTGPLDVVGNRAANGIFATGTTQTFGLRVSSNGGGVVVRAYGDSEQDGYALINNTGAKVFNVRASDGLAFSQGDFRLTSDARVKENLELIPDALDKIRRIGGYTYDRTDMKMDRQAGVVAQEVLKVLPEVVTEGDDGRYAVSYNQLQALLIEAIKEIDSKYSQLVDALVKSGVFTEAQLT